MTVSSSFSFDLTRDALIRRAAQRAGLLDAGGVPDGDTISMASDFLNIILQDLASEGVTLYQRERTTLPLLASTAAYSLAADTLDVLVGPNNFAGTIVDASGSEVPITAINGHDYVLLSNKSSEATTPTFVYIEKLATVTVTFWPVPSAATTFRYQRVRLIRDADTGEVTMDVAKRWASYLFYALAADLAGSGSKPLEVVDRLRGAAKEAKKTAKSSDREMVGGQLYVPRYSGGCR